MHTLHIAKPNITHTRRRNVYMLKVCVCALCPFSSNPTSRDNSICLFALTWVSRVNAQSAQTRIFICALVKFGQRRTQKRRQHRRVIYGLLFVHKQRESNRKRRCVHVGALLLLVGSAVSINTSNCARMCGCCVFIYVRHYRSTRTCGYIEMRTGTRICGALL